MNEISTVKHLIIYRDERDRSGLPPVKGADVQGTLDIIHYVVSQPKQGGHTLDEVELGLEIKASIRKAVETMGDAEQGILELENAPAARLQALFKAMRWPSIADTIPPLCKAVADMKDPPVPEKSA
jgi:hypothetical protein